MNPLESFSVDTNGNTPDGRRLCEVCGGIAGIIVLDFQRHPEDASAFPHRSPFGEHAFCDEHVRGSRDYWENGDWHEDTRSATLKLIEKCDRDWAAVQALMGDGVQEFARRQAEWIDAELFSATKPESWRDREAML